MLLILRKVGKKQLVFLKIKIYLLGHFKLAVNAKKSKVKPPVTKRWKA